MIASCLTLGNSSKKGPIQSSTNVNIPHEMIDAICVRPPVDCWITERDNDADSGRHEKNEPTRLDAPIASNS